MNDTDTGFDTDRPGAPPPPPTVPQALPALGRGLSTRCATLGTTCLVLSVLEFLYCLQRLASPFIGRAMMTFQQSLADGKAGASVPNPVIEAAQAFARRTAVWESLRTAPFLLATILLFWIGLRLRRGDLEALRAARTWTFGAFAAIALSILIQVLVTLPATFEYQRQLAALMLDSSKGTAPPAAIGQMMSTMTLFMVVTGVVMGTLLLSVWPTVLHVWAGRLRREALDHP